MVGLLIELLISWLFLWWFNRSNLSVLGFKLTRNRSFNFIFGFLTASFFCILYYTTYSCIANNDYIINKDFKIENFLKSAWWILSSVLFEELIFRGALLYIAIIKFGIRKACIMSSIAFGIYHWFSYGALGNPMQMLIIFVMTAIWGLMFCYAYAKTKSLYLPIGLHLGWNLVNTLIFSKGPLGNQFLISVGDKKLEGMVSLLFFILQIFALPLLTYIYLKKSHSKNY